MVVLDFVEWCMLGGLKLLINDGGVWFDMVLLWFV